MPEKNVREMSAVERRHYSLSARTFRAAATGCILLGLIAMVIGLGFYGYALSHQYVRHAFDLAVYAAASEPHGVDYAGIAEKAYFNCYRGYCRMVKHLLTIHTSTREV